jgi:hypothetical protein
MGGDRRSRSVLVRVALGGVCAAAALLGPGVVQASAATTPVDCTSVPTGSPDLQTTLNDAASGDTIVINGFCTGTFTLPSMTPLTIEGATGTTSGFDGQDDSASAPMLSGESLDDVTIQNLTFENAYPTDPAGAGALYADITEGTLTLNGDTFDNNGSVESPDVGGLDESPTFLVSDPGPDDNDCASQANSIVVENSTFENNGLLLPEFNPAFNFAAGGAGLGIYLLCALNPTTLTDNTFTGNTVLDEEGDLPGVGGGLSIVGDTLDDEGLPAVTQTGNVFSDNEIETEPGNPENFYAGAGEWAEAVELQSTDDRFTDNTLPGSDSEFGSFGAGIAVGASCLPGYANLYQDVIADNVLAIDTSGGDEGDDAEGAAAALFDYPVEAYFPGPYFEYVCEGGIPGPRTNSPFARAGANSKFAPQGSATPSGTPRSTSQAGIADQPEDNGDLTLDDTTVTGNAVTDGGSVAPSSDDATAGIWIVDALADDQFLELDNTILYGDVGGAEDSYEYVPFAGGPKNAIANQSVVQGISADYSDFCDDGAPFTGAGNICADPLLVDDGYQPSVSTPNEQETSSSPTIDAGSNDILATGLTTDFYGYPRTVSGKACPLATGTVDIGAAEYQPVCATTPPATTTAPPPQTTTVPKLQPCESRRDIVMHLRIDFNLPTDELINAVKATLTSPTVAGFGSKTLHATGQGHDILHVDLRKDPYGSFRVRVRIAVSTGQSKHLQRLFHTCRVHPFVWPHHHS